MAIRVTNTLASPFSFAVRTGPIPSQVFTANLGPSGSTTAAATIPFSLEQCNRDATFRALTSGATPRLRITEVAESNAIGGAVGAVPSTTVGGIGSLFVAHVPLPSGGTAGTADAVNAFAANAGGVAPFALTIVDVVVAVQTAVAASNVQLHNTASGGGSTTYSTALATTATGKVRDASTTMADIAAGGTVFVRRSDRSMVGELAIICLRTA